MLKVGTKAPPFVGRTGDGRVVTLKDWAGRPLVLYFFPKAFTPGCTVETKGFRDNYPELQALGFEVLGISTDSKEAQCRFAQHHGVTYPMIADQDVAITKSYDVRWPLLRFARRVTYVLDAEHKIAAAFHHEFQASRHLDDVLSFARKHPRNT